MHYVNWIIRQGGLLEFGMLRYWFVPKFWTAGFKYLKEIKSNGEPKRTFHPPSAQWSMLLFLIISLFCINNLHAQVVNIENKRIYDDTLGWDGEVAGLFSAQQNNDLLLKGNVRSRVQYKMKKQTFFLIGDYLYAKGRDRVYANTGMFHLRYDHRIKESKWKYEAYTQIQFNEILDQRYRFIAGGGLRLKILNKKSWKFFAGVSTFYEQEKYVSSNQIQEDLRSSNYLSWFINPKSFFSFSGATYYQPLWNDFDDYRILGQYTLNFKITKRFSIKTNLNFFHDSNPQPDIRKTIYATTVGFGYNLK